MYVVDGKGGGGIDDGEPRGPILRKAFKGIIRPLRANPCIANMRSTVRTSARVHVGAPYNAFANNMICITSRLLSMNNLLIWKMILVGS
jgi:hypothetical protein